MCINEDVMSTARRADGRVDSDKVNESCLEFNETYMCRHNREVSLEKTLAAYKEAVVWDIEDAMDMVLLCPASTQHALTCTHDRA